MAKMLHITIQTTRFEEEIAFYEKEAGLTLQRDMRPMKDPAGAVSHLSRQRKG